MMSAPLHTVREDCRMCRGRRLERVLSLDMSPPANGLLRAEDLAGTEPSFPLTVALCLDCKLVQLREVVSPDLLFRNYVYVSSTSPSFVAHFERGAESIIQRLGLKPNSLIVDIGSNDGILLRPYQARGMRVLGVDPAREIARQATESGIETIPEFFTPALADQIRAERGPASLITATNVFAHIDDLDAIAEGVKTLLTPEGTFIFECAYLIDFLEQNLFDTVYHEHLCYYGVQPVKAFFARFGMEVFAAERIPTHGGSIRVFIGHAGAHAIDPSVEACIAHEERVGAGRVETFRAFADAVERNRTELRALLQQVASEGGVIAGYGAPAKATTLLNYADIGPDTIRYIVDDSAWKQGLYLPGKRIPIVASAELTATPPTHLVILAWNFAPQIMQKLEAYRAQGGRFIIPVPTPHIV